LLILLALDGYTPSWTWIVGIPYLLAVQALLIMGIVLFFASIVVFFRDLEHLTDVFVGLIWFWLTPVVYPLSIVPDRYEAWLLANPMTSLIEGWRDLFLRNQIPGLELWPALAFAAGMAALGTISFRKLEGGFADAL
jgi:ABC-type polysaccharide/polyol phosphate export permease